MSYDQIWNAFDLAFSTFAANGDIVTEGDPYTPVEGRPYVMTKLAAYSRVPTGPGANCVMQESGSYMVSLRVDAAEGRNGASAIAEQVVALFPRGRTLTTPGGQFISILVASALPAIPDGAWLTVPISISFFATDP